MDNHSKGQQDYTEGKYDPPHGIVENLIDTFFSSTETVLEKAQANDEYNAGHNNARNQDR